VLVDAVFELRVQVLVQCGVQRFFGDGVEEVVEGLRVGVVGEGGGGVDLSEG